MPRGTPAAGTKAASKFIAIVSRGHGNPPIALLLDDPAPTLKTARARAEEKIAEGNAIDPEDVTAVEFALMRGEKLVPRTTVALFPETELTRPDDDPPDHPGVEDDGDDDPLNELDD